MRSKQENNIQEKLCKKFVEEGGGFWQVQTQPLMDFLITLCHTVIGNHLPKAQQGQASVTYTLWPKKCCDHLVRPSAAATTATVSSSSIVGFCFTFFSLLSLYLNTLILLQIPPKINTGISWRPRFSPSPTAFFAPAPTAIPQLFDEGEECHNTLGVNQTQRQAEQTIPCVCVCACVCVKINHSGFLRLPTAECRHGERLRALGQGGGRHPSGLPSPPRLPHHQAHAAACKAIPSCQLVPWAACKPLPAAVRGTEGFEPASCCGSPSRARHIVQALLKATSGPPAQH